MKKNSLYIIAIAFLSFSCGEYQKLLKSSDPDLKYNKAIEYFEAEDYMRAQTLLDDVTAYYRGTERSEDVLYYLAESYMGQKDYYSATEYYQTYVKTYPKGEKTDYCKYMVGYCYYLDSPDSRLDQTSTENAVLALQEFIDIYPESNKVQDANKLLEELADKLAYKEYKNADLYYNLGNYLGNNYESAIIVSENAIEQYPANKYREELLFIILKAKYQQALMSVEDRREERYQDAMDEYYAFVTEYPDSKHQFQLKRIYSDINKVIKD